MNVHLTDYEEARDFFATNPISKCERIDWLLWYVENQDENISNQERVKLLYKCLNSYSYLIPSNTYKMMEELRQFGEGELQEFEITYIAQTARNLGYNAADISSIMFCEVISKIVSFHIEMWEVGDAIAEAAAFALTTSDLSRYKHAKMRQSKKLCKLVL
jgi:hypothetical protein